jgi:putative ABC transport system substrate-binding protein
MDALRTIIKPMAVMLAVLTCSALYGNQEESTAQGQRPRLIVLSSHHTAPYEEVLESFKEYLGKQSIAVDLEICILDRDTAKMEQVIQRAKREPARLVFTLGSVATRIALKEFETLPIVAGLIVSGDEIEGKAGATGVFLDFPLEIQFQWMRRILPDCKNIGVLYNPARNHGKIELAQQVAASMGLVLHAQKVQVPADLPNALDSLAARIDVLWGVPDDLVYTPLTSRHILLFSFRNRIPLIGLSKEWVKAGALYSLEWDYRDLGIQCAEKALKMLQGARPDSYLPEGPRTVRYALNLKTAEHMKIEIEETLIHYSQQLFK